MARRTNPITPLAALSDADLYTSLKRAVSQRITSGEIPSMLAEVYRRGLWKGLEHPSRGHLGFRSFTEFVQSSPDGLGLDPVVILTIARRAGLPRVESMLSKAFARDRGGDQRSEAAQTTGNNITIDPTPKGTSRARALRVLEQQRPELHQRVLDGELSPHRAMIEAGLREATITLPLNLDRAGKILARYFTPEALRQFCPVCGTHGKDAS